MVTTTELAQARDAAAAVLDELGIDAFLFEVEPDARGAGWHVNVECAIDGSRWERVTLSAPKNDLLASGGVARGHLLRQWSDRLVACRRR